MAVGLHVLRPARAGPSAHLLGQLGPLGIAGLRLACAGVLLLILIRPRPRDFTGQDLLACALLGVVTAGPDAAVHARRSRASRSAPPARWSSSAR